MTSPDPIALRQFRPHDRLGNVQEDEPPPNLQGGRGTTTSEPQPRSPMSITPQVSDHRELRDGGAPSQRTNGVFPPGKRELLRGTKSALSLFLQVGLFHDLTRHKPFWLITDLDSTHSPWGIRGTEAEKEYGFGSTLTSVTDVTCNVQRVFVVEALVNILDNWNCADRDLPCSTAPTDVAFDAGDGSLR